LNTPIWETKEIFAALIGGICLLAVPWLRSLLAKRREDSAAARQDRRDGIEGATALYVEAVVMLEAKMENPGAGDGSYAENTGRIIARMRLLAPTAVLRAFNAAADRVDVWTRHQRAGELERIGTSFSEIQASVKHHREGQELLTKVFLALEAFRQATRNDLDAREAAKAPKLR
jgi:hypothetical protein